MINIIENTPEELSGTSSLFLKFSYNKEVINIIKKCNCYVYNSKNYTWEVPVTNLSFLLDELTYFDDITLKLKKDNATKTYKRLTKEEIESNIFPDWFLALDKILSDRS